MRSCILLSMCLVCTFISAQQWYVCSVPRGRDVNAIYIQNPNDFFVAGGHISNDSIQDIYSGNSVDWNFLLDIPATRSMLLDIYFTDSLHGYACGLNGGMLRSTDAGQTWNLMPTPILGRNYRKLVFSSAAVGFAVGSNYNDSTETIITTIDSGKTWTLVTDQAGPGLSAVTFINADTGFAVGDSGVILTTTNGGSIWTPTVSPLITPLTAIKFINADTGYIVGGDDTSRAILGTTNGGATWNIIKHEHGFQLSDITFYHNKGYIVGNYSTLLVSTNSGQTWTYDSVSAFSTISALTSVRFYNDSFGIIGAKGGNIFIYKVSRPASVYTMSASNIDSTDVTIYANVNTHGEPAQYSFMITTDSLWSSPGQTFPVSFKSDSPLIVNTALPNLTPNIFYYYYAECQTLSGMSHGDTMKFYTGTPYTTFLTQPPTNITSTSATLNGTVAKFVVPVALDFEYGITPAMGSHIQASPASINDTLPHNITASLTGLLPGVVYYYRLRGQTSFGYEYGNISTLYTGSAYSNFATLPASGLSDSTAILTGSIEGFTTPVTLSFQYGNTPSFSTTLTNTNPNNVTDTALYTITGYLGPNNLQANTLYFYRLVAQTGLGTFYANTMTFFTGSGLVNAFSTLSASGVTSSTATLNGRVSHFPTAVSVEFEYGTTQAFGNTVACIPASVNDTATHLISGSLTGLNVNTVYYYRLKGTYSGGTIYGSTEYLYTGNSDIPNWDFQKWYRDTVSLPYNWRLLTDRFAQVPGHSGNYAIKIFGPSAVIMGAIGDGPSGRGPSFFGGAPLNARPDSLVAYLNYNFPPGDTGAILLYLYTDTNVLANEFYALSGSSGGAWARVAVPISYNIPTMLADSIVMGFASLNPNAQTVNLQSGSFIAIDDVTFSPPPPVPLPNAGFENWFTYSSDKFADWYGLNYVGFDYATMTNTPMVSLAYFNPPFDYAAQVSNILIEGKAMASSMGSNPSALFGSNNQSFPVFVRHQTFNGFYKYYPANKDSVRITVNMFKNGQPIGYGQFLQGDTVDVFSPFEAVISYNNNQTPDSAAIQVQPSNGPAKGLSYVIVDKFSFDGYITGILEAAARKEGAKVWAYPNPASTRLTIETSLPEANTEVTLTDINGRVIKESRNLFFETKTDMDQKNGQKPKTKKPQ